MNVSSLSSASTPLLTLINDASEKGEFEVKVKKPWLGVLGFKPQLVLAPKTGLASLYGSFKAYFFSGYVKEARQAAAKKICDEIAKQYSQDEKAVTNFKQNYLTENSVTDLSNIDQQFNNLVAEKGITVSFVKNFIARSSQQSISEKISESGIPQNDSTRDEVASVLSGLTSAVTISQEIQKASRQQNPKEQEKAENENQERTLGRTSESQNDSTREEVASILSGLVSTVANEALGSQAGAEKFNSIISPSVFSPDEEGDSDDESDDNDSRLSERASSDCGKIEEPSEPSEAAKKILLEASNQPESDPENIKIGAAKDTLVTDGTRILNITGLEASWGNVSPLEITCYGFSSYSPTDVKCYLQEANKNYKELIPDCENCTREIDLFNSEKDKVTYQFNKFEGKGVLFDLVTSMLGERMPSLTLDRNFSNGPGPDQSTLRWSGKNSLFESHEGTVEIVGYNEGSLIKYHTKIVPVKAVRTALWASSGFREKFQEIGKFVAEITVCALQELNPPENQE